MTLTPAEAQSALKDIERTESRSASSQHGRYAAPHLISWGMIWIVGYMAGAIWPLSTWIWAPLILVGVVSSILINRSAQSGKAGGYGWRYATSFGAIFIFIFALFSVMRPTAPNQYAAFFPLVIGLCYAFMGIWTRGWRMAPLGLALMGLTITGYFLLPEHFSYWMAAVGGGGLILGGLWMRSV